MSNVRELKLDEPDTEIVHRCEQALARARAGEYTGIVIVGQVRGGETHTMNWSTDRMLQVAGLEYAKLKILMEMHEDARDAPDIETE